MHCTFIPPHLLPTGWRASISRPGVYRVLTEPTEKLTGTRSLSIVAEDAGPEDFVILKQAWRADDHVGRRIQLSGFLKSSEVDGYAALWMRVDAAHRSPVAFDNMEAREVTGTTDWKEHRVVLDVPDDGVQIAFGLRFGGQGQIWVDRFAIAEVGSDVATTDMRQAAEDWETTVPDTMPRHPVNLDFEA